MNNGRLHVGGRRGSFIDTTAEKQHGRRSTGTGLGMEKSEMRSRARSKSRARSVEYERESVLRGEMPHRRQKDKAWWEGMAEGMGMKSGDADRREKDNIRFEDEGYVTRDTGRSPKFKDDRRSSRVDNGGTRSPRRSSMRV
jgi:osmotically-inducible protein OsmY